MEDTGADAIELNFGCPHGMSERGMGAAVGQVPEYIQMVTEWCKQYSKLPVIVKLTPNITDIRNPARAAKKGGGADAVSADQHHQLHHGRGPVHADHVAVDWRQGLARRLLWSGREADRAKHGGRDCARPADGGPADFRHRRHW